MAFTFVTESAHGDGPTDDTSLAAPAVSVTAGDLIVVGVKYEGSATTFTLSDGGNSYTDAFAGAHNTVSDLFNTMYYAIAASTASITISATPAGSRPWKGICVQVWRPTSGYTVSLDGTRAGAGGASSSASSGNMTTSGSDGVVFGFYGEYGTVITTWALAGTGSSQDVVDSDSGQRDNLFSRTYSAGFTGAATGTLDSSNNWVMGILAFKQESGGGGGATYPGYMWSRGGWF